METDQPLFVKVKRTPPVDIKSEPEEFVVTRMYSSAKEFLKDISYEGELYDKMYGGYIYRGLSSGTFDLIPSSLRQTRRLRNLDCTVFIDEASTSVDFANSELLQREMEYFELRQFFEICDTNNLRLPNVDRMRKYILSYNDMGSVALRTDNWIPYDLQELAALAQHYGMKTRLLDWTNSIETAIYFAVRNEPVLSKTEKDNTLSGFVVIWILDTSVEYHTSLSIIRPPYYGNSNLAAQKGLFTFWKEPGFKLTSNIISEEENLEHLKVRINRTPLDSRLEKELSSKVKGKTVMWKLLIPRADRKVLYDFINKKGINAASLFPGYAGVVRSIKEDIEIQDWWESTIRR